MPHERRTLTNALGWASLGLGASETLAPGAFLRFLGARDTPNARLVTIGACGLRELGAAGGILAVERRPRVRTLHARVAGDVLDLTLLARALRGRPARPQRLIGAIVATAGVTAADVVAAVSNQRARDSERNAGRETERDTKEVPNMQNKVAITVRCSASEAQERWRELATQPDGPFRLGPLEILESRNRVLGWRTTGDGAQATGVIGFFDAPGDQGTELHIELKEGVPGGVVGEAVQKLTGDEPFVRARDDLRRFKQIVETGEIPRSEGTPSGHSAKEHVHQRPAQPVG